MANQPIQKVRSLLCPIYIEVYILVRFVSDGIEKCMVHTRHAVLLFKLKYLSSINFD